MRRLGYALGFLLATYAAPVSAYSSFADYVRPIEEGGGGGHMFTGTPADGHSCDVCHRGAEAAPLEVLGLPLDGYVPQQTYEIRFQWPATTPHVAVIAEFTDVAGAPAGVTALAPYASWQPSEKCEEGNNFPAADVCRVGGAGSGCCRELEPTRDACSFPSERSVFWMLDCGSKSARVVWTAPATGDVWFSSAMVTSDVHNDARGDGSFLVRKRLRVAGASAEVVAATGSCEVASQSGGGAWVLLLAAGVLFVRRRMQQRFPK